MKRNEFDGEIWSSRGNELGCFALPFTIAVILLGLFLDLGADLLHRVRS